MAATIATFQDVYLRARAFFDRWLDEFAAEFTEPQVLNEMRATLAALSPQQQQTLRESDPEAFDMMIKLIHGGDHAR